MIRFNFTIELTQKEFDTLDQYARVNEEGLTDSVQKILKDKLADLSTPSPAPNQLTIELD